MILGSKLLMVGVLALGSLSEALKCGLTFSSRCHLDSLGKFLSDSTGLKEVDLKPNAERLYMYFQVKSH